MVEYINYVVFAFVLAALFMLITGCTGTNHESDWSAKCDCGAHKFECSRSYERNKIDLKGQ